MCVCVRTISIFKNIIYITETYRAVHQPPICYQRDWKEGFKPTRYEIVRELVKMDSSVLNYYETHKSEDCLYLSIFTRTGADLSIKNRTVLVWIHGGAFISGTSSFPFQDYPSLIANDPNLVVVAINYRLNVFGFITSGDKLLSGNYGLKDQVKIVNNQKKWFNQLRIISP